MAELSDESRALLSAFSAEATPTDARQEAVWQRVDQAVTTGGPITGGGSWAATKLLAVIGGGVLTTVVALVSWPGTDDEPEVLPVVAPEVTIERVAPPATVDRPISRARAPDPPEPIPSVAPVFPARPDEDPEPEAKASPPPRSSPHRQTDGADSLAAEMRLMGAARAAIRRDEHAAALKLLSRHHRGFPRGALRQEAAALRVVALCGVGRVEAATAAARRFVETWPTSPSAARMRRPCASDMQ